MDLKQLPRDLVDLELRALRLPLDVFRTVTARGGADGPQTSDEQTRQATFDEVVGRTKELAGAVLRQDALARQGHLQRAKADELRKAIARDALAEQQKVEADRELAEKRSEVQQERTQVARETTRRKAEVQRQKQAEKARVEQEFEQREAEVEARTGRKKALVDKAEASVKADRAAKVGEAAQHEQAADKAKATAEKLDRARNVG